MTVKKYLSQLKTKHGLKGKTRPSELDPFKPKINEMMGNGIFNCVVILERLREMVHKTPLFLRYNHWKKLKNI